MNRNLTRLGVCLAASLLLTGLAGCELPGAAGGKQNQQTGNEQNQTGKAIHEGTISQNETWKKADGPHIIKGAVYVESEQGVTVTIEPGTEVRFEQDASLHFGYSNGTRGVLLAQGTADQPIVFTSAASSPQKGDWEMLYLGNGSASSILTHCAIKYGGSVDAALYVDGEHNKPTLSNCTIEQSANYGIRMVNDASFKAFDNNVIKTSGQNPLRIGANEVGTLGSGNTFADNAKAAIYVEGETIDKSATWQNVDVSYVMQGHTFVGSDATLPVLTLKPGVTLEFAQAAGLHISMTVGQQGALNAVGTPEEKITFTGVGKDAGSWDVLSMWAGTKAGVENDANTTVLQHAVIEYGGGEAGDDAALLYLNDAKPIVKNVTFRHSGSGKAVAVRGERSKVPAYDSWGAEVSNGSGNVFGLGLGVIPVEDAAMTEL